MLFAGVASTTERVAATRARSRKVAALADLLRALGPAELPVVVPALTGTPRQGRIGIGWRTLARLDVAPAPEPALQVSDVDEALSHVTVLHGPGSQAARAAVLRDLLGRATAPEQDLIRRLLGGELRHGALEGVVTDAVARANDIPLGDVRRAAMLAGDLARVAVVARARGAGGLARIGLTVLRPVQPMLAQTAGDVDEALALALSPPAPASVEWKLDGARIQVHRDGDTVRVFTRSLNEVTDRLPGIVEVVRGLPARALVLDGEAVGVGEDELPDAFQDTMSRFGRQAPGNRAPGSQPPTDQTPGNRTPTSQAATDRAPADRAPADVAAVLEGERGDDEVTGLAARFFDLLHLDGRDLIDRPLAERLELLERVAGPWRIPGRLTAEPAEARQVLEEALAAGHEGVMVKDADSPYEAGRRGGAWRKVKPVHTFDLVVLAVEWGSGRRKGWLSNLHLGARDPEGGFVMVGKTFKGLTDELLTWQTERFLSLEASRTGHVVEVRPEQVVEIALDGVQSSTRYAGGVALRFARVRRYRHDKAAGEADTIDAVRALLPRRRSAG